MLTPKIGDAVIIEGVVTEVISGDFKITTPGMGEYPHLIHTDRIKEIVPKLWVPAVGDKCVCHNFSVIYTILSLYENYVWISWSKDSFSTISLNSLKENYTLCVG